MNNETKNLIQKDWYKLGINAPLEVLIRELSMLPR